MSMDGLVINPGRLAILTTLAEQPRQAFVQVRRQTRLTDGNLACHARRLQAGGLIDICKAPDASGKAQTFLSLTPSGRAALQAAARDLASALAKLQAIDAQGVEPREDDWVD